MKKRIIAFLLLIVAAGLIYFFFFYNQPISSQKIKQGVDINLEEGVDRNLILKNSEYFLRAIRINEDNSVDFVIYKEDGSEFNFNLGESGYFEKDLDINYDFINDINARLRNVDKGIREVLIYFKEIDTRVCDESWTCTDWYPCVYDVTQITGCPVGSTTIGECYVGTQTRDCSDDNNCGTSNYKPDTEQTCYVPVQS